MPTRSPEELRDDIQRAVTILELFTDPKKGRDISMLIPQSILRDAHGIVFIRLYKIGFMVSAKSGTGVIIARLPDGSWSAPSGVSISSLGFGHQAGGQMIDSIIVMNYRAAVKAFYDGGGQLQLGVGASLAAGPFGRAADVAASASSTTHIAATYAYSASKGLYAGYSFEGSRISERPNTNRAYYGRPISAKDILTGQVAPPQDAAKLYDMLNALGAGPRPGFPFAPQKTHDATPSLPPQQPQTSRHDGFHEPPPPYELNDPSRHQEPSTSSPTSSPSLKHRSNDVSQVIDTSLTNHPDTFDQLHSASQPSSQYPKDIKKPLEDPMTVVVAKYDYTADRPTDLSFKAGDTIIVTKRVQDRQAWWEGEIGDKRGFFPANYTKDITQ